MSKLSEKNNAKLATLFTVAVPDVDRPSFVDSETGDLVSYQVHEGRKIKTLPLDPVGVTATKKPKQRLEQ